jgi:hypothetical protein
MYDDARTCQRQKNIDSLFKMKLNKNKGDIFDTGYHFVLVMATHFGNWLPQISGESRNLLRCAHL